MNQATEQWETFAGEFYRDGSFRDIYVFETTAEDWSRLGSFLVAEKYKIRFSGAWSNASFPDDVGQLFPSGPESALTVLTIDVSGVLVNCHFFSQEEIELDLDPAEVDGPSKLDAIFCLMRGLANALGKEVLLTPENMREIAIFRCGPQTAVVEHTPFGGFS